MPKKIVAAKKGSAPRKVESIRHKDKRTNIPTEELRDFVVEEELAPKTMLYPRDSSLDPQLVWKGKDQQDREDLAVPVVPIYIQEKIHPQAIIDALPRIEEQAGDQTNLFVDFNGGPKEFEKKVDFYHYQQNWSNRMILGDSLLVMTSLAEKEGLKGKVQTIYIDPPYGIKFGSNWQVSTRKRDVKDGKAEDATRQPEQVRAFRDTWKLGIHSYLAYLRDRLVVARDLISETGSIFIQIGDENVHLVRCLLDEVFGAENFQAQINFKSMGALGQSGIPKTYDYLLWYAKNTEVIKFRPLFRDQEFEGDPEYRFIDDSSPSGYRTLENGESFPEANRGLFRRSTLTSSGYTESCTFEFSFNGQPFRPFSNKSWRTNAEGMERLKVARRIFVLGGNPYFKRYATDFSLIPIENSWTDAPPAYARVYVVQTAEKFIERCILMTTDPGDLVLDPTCGSGTTAYVAEEWGRRWITCDTSRVALALARTRLMGAKYPYYLLADSPDGIKKESELTGKVPPEHKTEEDIRKGFVYKRVPHVTLGSIANNPDIREGMTSEEIKAAIAKYAEADAATLFDQPYDDNKRVRVCGPFSVESLSPHRVLPTADDDQDNPVTEQEAQKQQDFAAMILDNLKKAGVQNTRRNERLTFDRLDAYAGVWLNAAGEYTDAEGKSRRVAVTIGPEYGTVGPQQVKEAAKEAVQGVGFDLLVVCGFAFDPHVAEEVKRYGKLTVLPTKMNPDLAMGDELLKKTGAGNLFMVFGEPDVDIRREKNGQIVVEIKGVDVYDPTTGQIRSSSTDDIACWFIDTDYNGESFFVRHAYFTGAEEPYEKLQRALRADIDEAAWSSLYRTISRPFKKPDTGKIAVKVINHYGDEVLKVFTL
jgi:adenine-specific DNA-methyltransferase